MKRISPFVCLIILLILLQALCLQSCDSYKRLPYLTEVETLTPEQLALTRGVNEARIKPNDILKITVNSIIPGATSDFNLPLVPSSQSTVQTSISSASSTTGSLQNYTVNNNGYINFPVIGEILLSGMTIEEAKGYIVSLIYPKYISEKPIVNIDILNFKVAVLGEVAKPGVYESINAQMTLFDALAAAGDLTIYGKRDNVLLLRTKDDGELVTYRLNLQDKDLVLNKDLYYLQQNDKLIVEVNKAKGNNSRFGTVESIGISTLSIIISLIAIITR